jgi:hypothetical protein
MRAFMWSSDQEFSSGFLGFAQYEECIGPGTHEFNPSKKVVGNII